MPREIKDMNIDEVSVVDKAANKRRLLMLKAEDPLPEDGTVGQEINKSAWPSGRIEISLNLDAYKTSSDAMDDEAKGKIRMLVDFMQGMMGESKPLKKQEPATPAPAGVDSNRKEAVALAENAMSELNSLSDEGVEVSPEVLDAAQKVQDALSKL